MRGTLIETVRDRPVGSGCGHLRACKRKAARVGDAFCGAGRSIMKGYGGGIRKPDERRTEQYPYRAVYRC
jgi:hypothetical protein